MNGCDPDIEARLLVAQAGGTRVSRPWLVQALADVCAITAEAADLWTDYAIRLGLLEQIGDTLRLAEPLNQRFTPLDPDELAAAQAAVREHELGRAFTREELVS